MISKMQNKFDMPSLPIEMRYYYMCYSTSTKVIFASIQIQLYEYFRHNHRHDRVFPNHPFMIVSNTEHVTLQPCQRACLTLLRLQLIVYLAERAQKLLNAATELWTYMKIILII